MGIVKSLWMRDEDRGWSDPETHVCLSCVGQDTYLRSLVRKGLTTNTCNYCESKSRKAAPVSVIMDAVLRGVKYSFNDEASAGCPYTKDIEIDYLTSEDVLYQVLHSDGVDWPDALVGDVASAFANEGWVEAPDGSWMGAHQHERLHWSWNSFAEAVKHRSRFHFQTRKRSPRWGDDTVAVEDMLPFIGRLVRQHRMVRKLPMSTVLHRVRLGTWPSSVAELGPPPKELAGAGRMNPAGIPYLYLAFDEKTALAETRSKAGVAATISSWSPARDLHVIDLLSLPACPSIFSEMRHEYDLVQFLWAFVSEITQSVAHDGREHIEYVPTQVVSEYFAQAFQYGDRKRVDGLIYPSAVSEGGKNLVVFPNTGGGLSKFDLMKLRAANSGRVNRRRDAVR